MNDLIVLVGGTGDLGGRVAAALGRREAAVRALVRPGTELGKVATLRGIGAEVLEVDFADAGALARACEGAACVVSCVSGLRPVIVDLQTQLLNAAVAAGVPRFVPSDFAMDYTQVPAGSNRNLELRQVFKARLDAAPIRATSILNGAFADLLSGQAPIVLFKWKRVLYWHNADQRMDFTTKDDVAEFTAAAACDPSTPRTLRIAGDSVSARELVQIMGEITGERFKLFRAGGLTLLGGLIRVARTVSPGKYALYPAWQGMQYVRNMFAGQGKLGALDNDRYPMHWTTARAVLVEAVGKQTASSSSTSVG